MMLIFYGMIIHTNIMKFLQLSHHIQKFIEVIVKIKGNMEYSSPHIYNEKKEVHDNIKVTAKDVQLVIKEVLGINLEIDNIHV